MKVTVYCIYRMEEPLEPWLVCEWPIAWGPRHRDCECKGKSGCVYCLGTGKIDQRKEYASLRVATEIARELQLRDTIRIRKIEYTKAG